MTDQPPKRGLAAYKAKKEEIQARNDAARKAGREQRAADERKQAARRHAADREDAAGLRHTFQ